MFQSLSFESANVLHSKFVSTLKDTLEYLEMMVKPPYHPQILYFGQQGCESREDVALLDYYRIEGPWIPPPTSLLSSAYRYLLLWTLLCSTMYSLYLYEQKGSEIQTLHISDMVQKKKSFMARSLPHFVQEASKVYPQCIIQPNSDKLSQNLKFQSFQFWNINPDDHETHRRVN